MKKQRKTEKENQKSEILENDLISRDKEVFTGNRSRTLLNTLLVQNTIKGPPGRSRSPGTETIHPIPVQTDLLINYEFIYKHLQQLNKLNINVLSIF